MKSFLYACLFFLIMVTNASSEEAEISERAERVFSEYKNSVLQIRIIDRTSKSKSSIGSGFFIRQKNSQDGPGSKDRLIVTNFHVVSDWIYKPERYEIKYLLNNKQQGKLTLIGIDVVHDLALLRTQKDDEQAKPEQAFEFSSKKLRQGEHLYSFGNPHDIGLSIVEGTYNGYIEKSLYKKIHFTGSVNPGMSGGPVVDRDGKVVGVNVSGAGNQLSFLVPVEYVARLAEQAKSAEQEKDFMAMISDQLLANQEDYMSKLLQQPLKTTRMDQYQLPGDLGDFMKCWGGTRDKDKQLYERTYKICQTEDDIYLSSGQRSGVIEYQHDLFKSKGLGKTRFFNLVERLFMSPQISLYGEEDQVTNFECRTRQVKHQGTKSKLVFCLRGYKKIAGIYDAWLSSVVLASNQEALRTTALLSGISYENARAFSEAYMKQVQWQKQVQR